MRRITLSFVACPALQHFSTLSHKRHEFRGKKVAEHTVRILTLSTASARNSSRSKNNWEKHDQKRALVFI